MYTHETQALLDLLATVGRALAETRIASFAADDAFNGGDARRAAIKYNSAVGTAEGALEEVQGVLNRLVRETARAA